MRVILRKKQSLSKSQEAVDGVSRVYNVPRVVLSFSRSPLTPTSAQGISAREDAMTGFFTGVPALLRYWNGRFYLASLGEGPRGRPLRDFHT